MKRITTITMTLVLAIAITQCKKATEHSIDNIEDEKVSITLDVNNGERNIIYPETGAALFENGDVVYVGNNGHYVGTLTYNQGLFGGNITAPNESDYLHFYFMGNKTPEETINSNTTSLTVNISDQTNCYPEIAYAPSTVKYSSNVTAYRARLLNKCALVKFNVTTLSTYATCITGMKNKVIVDLGSHEFSYEQDGEGIIKLEAGEGEKWAILLPQEAVMQAGSGTAYSETGDYYGTQGDVPQISENGYLTTGIEVVVCTSATSTGTINGLFTINSEGDQVYFSRGNLQYQASTNTWRFAENQWDFVGGTLAGSNPTVYGNVYDNNGVKCNNSLISSNYNGWIDLFGWGTSGWNSGRSCYHPWDVSQTDNYYGPPGTYDLTNDYANADWGVYNAISNSGYTPTSWRTLTRSEWNYIATSRSTSSGIRYAHALVNGVKGVVLLPDDWSTSTYTLNNTNGQASSSSYNNNVISASQWNTLENAGAVFLPAAGSRQSSWYNETDYMGRYWSASSNASGASGAYHTAFNCANSSSFGGISNAGRHWGFSVRLVRNAE